MDFRTINLIVKNYKIYQTIKLTKFTILLFGKKFKNIFNNSIINMIYSTLFVQKITKIFVKKICKNQIKIINWLFKYYFKQLNQMMIFKFSNKEYSNILSFVKFLLSSNKRFKKDLYNENNLLKVIYHKYTNRNNLYSFFISFKTEMTLYNIIKYKYLFFINK